MHQRLTGFFLVMVIAGGAWGQDILDNLYLNGFISQGYLKSSDYNYLVHNSKEGTPEFTEAAISLMIQPSEKIHIGIQLMGRDFGDSENGEVHVDWAFADYRIRDWIGVRAGKLRMFMGMYNVGRDLDMLRTPVLLPQSVYLETQRDFTLAYEGVGLYGNVCMGKLGTLDYEAAGGTMNVSDAESNFWADIYYMTAWNATDLYAEAVAARYGIPVDQVIAESNGYSHANSYFPWSWGLSGTWNTPLDGLRLNYSFSRFKTKGDFRVLGSVYVPNTSSPLGFDIYSFNERMYWNGIVNMGSSTLEYSIRNFTFTFESITFYPTEENGDIQKSNGGYFMINHQVTPKFAWNIYFSEYYQNADDPDGDEYAKLGLPRWFAYDQYVSLSTRFDITDHWLIKLEVQGHDGIGGLTYVYNPQLYFSPEGQQEYWGMFLAKTTFHF